MKTNFELLSMREAKEDGGRGGGEGGPIFSQTHTSRVLKTEFQASRI